MWLPGNVGQQIDIEEIVDDVERLRARITNQLPRIAIRMMRW